LGRLQPDYTGEKQKKVYEGRRKKRQRSSALAKWPGISPPPASIKLFTRGRKKKKSYARGVARGETNQTSQSLETTLLKKSEVGGSPYLRSSHCLIKEREINQAKGGGKKKGKKELWRSDSAEGRSETNQEAMIIRPKANLEITRKRWPHKTKKSGVKEGARTQEREKKNHWMRRR